jgi:hypothetical protein
MGVSRETFFEENIIIDTAEMTEGVIAVVVSNKEMRNQQIPFSFLSARKDGEWLEGGSTQWDALALVNTTYPLKQLAVIGPHGNVHLTGSGDRHAEKIADGPFTPIELGLLRGARTIEGLPVVCGMKKQVYLRQDANKWQCISKDIAGGEGVHGFEAIDGFSLNDMYAVGWYGEVWHYNGATWMKIDVPTKNLLTDVCCAGDGTVYITGRGSTFITGRHNAWQVQQFKHPVELVTLCWFKGVLYAADFKNIYTCNTNGIIEPVFYPDAHDAYTNYTFGKLALGTGIMLSAGVKDWFTFDGTEWKKIN